MNKITEIKTFNMPELEKYIRDGIDFQTRKAAEKALLANSYREGYEEASRDILRILNASNFEVEDDD